MALPDAGDVARMRRIINRLRSYGVEVREMPGWEKRGFRFPAVPTRVFDHHDASSRKSGEWGALGLILDGTPRGIPGPLSNFQVARCLDGKPRVAVVAAGYTYHAGTGGPYGELRLNNANPATYGTEKANDGLGEPYTSAANFATNALFHAAAVESGADPANFPIGHKEWTRRKSDPLYSMADRRRQVGSFIPVESLETVMTDVASLKFVTSPRNTNQWWVTDGIFRRHVQTGEPETLMQLGLAEMHDVETKQTVAVIADWQLDKIVVAAPEVPAEAAAVDPAAIKALVLEALKEGSVNVNVSVAQDLNAE